MLRSGNVYWSQHVFSHAQLVVLLGIIIPLTRNAFADQPATAPTSLPAQREFTSPQYRIRLRYPADWTIPPDQPKGQIFSARTPQLGSDPNNFGVIILRTDRTPAGTTDAAALVDLADTVADFVFKNGGEHVTIKPDKLGDLSARRINFQQNTPSGPIHVICIVAVKDRVEYVFNLAAPANGFDSLLPEVDELLKSFELLD